MLLGELLHYTYGNISHCTTATTLGANNLQLVFMFMPDFLLTWHCHKVEIWVKPGVVDTPSDFLRRFIAKESVPRTMLMDGNLGKVLGIVSTTTT